MICPKCRAESKVVNSRSENGSTRRRRECLDCGNRWSTVEIPVTDAKPGRKRSSTRYPNIDQCAKDKIARLAASGMTQGAVAAMMRLSQSTISRNWPR